MRRRSLKRLAAARSANTHDVSTYSSAPQVPPLPIRKSRSGARFYTAKDVTFTFDGIDFDFSNVTYAPRDS